MTIRIATLSIAAALAALPAAAFAGEPVAATSSADAPRVEVGRSQADLAASYSPGTVGAMHYAVAGVATRADEIQSQGGRLTADAVRWRIAPQPGS